MYLKKINIPHYYCLENKCQNTGPKLDHSLSILQLSLCFDNVRDDWFPIIHKNIFWDSEVIMKQNLSHKAGRMISTGPNETELCPTTPPPLPCLLCLHTLPLLPPLLPSPTTSTPTPRPSHLGLCYLHPPMSESYSSASTNTTSTLSWSPTLAWSWPQYSTCTSFSSFHFTLFPVYLLNLPSFTCLKLPLAASLQSNRLHLFHLFIFSRP